MGFVTKPPGSLKSISNYGDGEKKLVTWETVVSLTKGGSFSKSYPLTEIT